VKTASHASRSQGGRRGRLEQEAAQRLAPLLRKRGGTALLDRLRALSAAGLHPDATRETDRAMAAFHRTLLGLQVGPKRAVEVERGLVWLARTAKRAGLAAAARAVRSKMRERRLPYPGLATVRTYVEQGRQLGRWPA